MTEDVLRDDDGAVVEHAHPQGQPAERHDIQGDAAEVEQVERGDDGYREDDSDDERGPELLEKQQENEEGENASFDNFVHGRRDGLLDEPPLLRNEPDIEGGNLAPDLLDDLFGGPRDADRVRSRRLADQDADALGAVEPGQPLALPDRINDPAHVLELDDAAAFGRPEARLAYLGNVRELAGDAEGVLEAAPADGPSLDIPVEVVEPLGDVLRGQAVQSDAGRVELDHDLPDVSARDLGLADAFDLLQSWLDDQLAEIPELARALRPGNG